jgi:hypothetical protein
VIFSELKTKQRKRTIDLDEIFIQLLRGHYERQQVKHPVAGENGEEYRQIFTTSDGAPIHPRNLL